MMSCAVGLVCYQACPKVSFGNAQLFGVALGLADASMSREPELFRRKHCVC